MLCFFPRNLSADTAGQQHNTVVTILPREHIHLVQDGENSYTLLTVLKFENFFFF